MGPIVINARAAARPELGGVERWARELATRLPALRPGGYRVARPPQALSHRAGHLWEQVALPALAHGAPAVLCPANLAPLALRNTVVVIHDAAALRNPGWYSRAYVAWQARVLPAIARRAAHVVTVSEFSRAELASVLGLDPARISVVAGGVGEQFRPDVAPFAHPRPYLLTVASHTARKNLGALDAAARGLDGLDVLVAGGDRPQFAGETGLEHVRLLGHVDEAALPGLYAGAQAVVVPSLHEGFGLVALEAMAAGTPVVATRAGALPETCGDAAVLVEPTPEALAAGIEEALRDRDRLVAAGRARAAGFTWDRTARAIDALLAASR